MNLPNSSLDATDRPGRLPSTAVDGSPIFTRTAPALSVNYGAKDAWDESGPDYRKAFFVTLALALKYRWLILSICALALAIGLVKTYTSTPIYQATATIQIEPQAPKVVKIDAVAEETGDRGGRFYQTQYDLLRSRSLAERVAADLNLAGDSDFLHPPSNSAWEKLRSLIFRSASTKREDTANFEQRKAAVAGIVQSGLSVAPVPTSSLVKISFDSPSPVWAQRIVNGVADSYVATNLERRYAATANARTFLKERLEELKLKLEESEKALVAYAEQKELISEVGKEGSRQTLADSDLAALNGALQKVVNERINAQELWEQANNGGELGLPQILEDKAVQTLRQQRTALMVDYQNKLSIFTPAYPDMRKLKAQIDQIDKEIKAAADVIKHSLKARYEAALQQEELIKDKMEETKRGVLDTRGKEIQYNILKREADTNRTLYDGLLQQYKDMGVAGAVSTNNIAIIDRAQLPGGPYKPDAKKTIMTFLVFGLVAAAGLIALLEIFDDTFKSPEELEEQLGLPVLGIIPLGTGDIRTDIAGLSNPIGEAYRSFRTALQFSTDQGAPKSIVITSAQPGEGKSTTAYALAVNFTQLGMKVLLIDADLRNPSQHTHIKRPNGSGLANYLAGQTAPGGNIQETDVDGLYFLSSGPIPPNPAELLTGPRMPSLLSMATEKVDTVIIDAPPIMGLADAPLLASMASGTLLVIATGNTRRTMVKAALKRLHFARARMVGTVMNKCDFRSAYGYGQYYGYGSALAHYGYQRKDGPAQLEHSSGG